jgi:hypothetical protein
MNDELHPDAIDDELSRRFGAGAPTDSDPDVVLDTMRPRLQQARTRRRASFATAIAGVAVVVVVLAFVLGSGGGGDGSVRTPPASNAPRTTQPSVSTTTPAGGSATPDTAPENEREQEQSVGTTPSVPDATPPTGPPETTPTPAPSVQHGSADSPGGSITYDFVDGRVSLTGSTPVPGYTVEVHDVGPTRIEVRFSNGQTEWRIRVDVDNGVLQPPEVTQH